MITVTIIIIIIIVIIISHVFVVVVEGRDSLKTISENFYVACCIVIQDVCITLVTVCSNKTLQLNIFIHFVRINIHLKN